MKNKVSAIFNIAAGLLLVFAPWFLFKVCSTEVKVMKCFWTSKAEIAVAVILIAIGLISFTISTTKELRALALVSIVVTAMAAALPAFIIGGCMKPAMACRTTAFPAIYIISLVNIAAQGIIIFCSAKDR